VAEDLTSAGIQCCELSASTKVYKLIKRLNYRTQAKLLFFVIASGSLCYSRLIQFSFLYMVVGYHTQHRQKKMDKSQNWHLLNNHVFPGPDNVNSKNALTDLFFLYQTVTSSIAGF